MKNWLSRTEQLIGKQALQKLSRAHVLVAGLGGVGAYAAEQIARAGVGKMTLADADTVQPTNRNRQLLALTTTQKRLKTDVMAERLKQINPKIEMHVFSDFLKDHSLKQVLNQAPYDYVVDAIDTLSPKIFLIKGALQRKMPVISSMGAGGKLDPTQVKIADISESYNCKLARMLRKKLHAFGIYKGVKVVFSPEKVPQHAINLTPGEPNKKSNVGTISYMPPLFGCFCASAVVRDLIEQPL